VDTAGTKTASGRVNVDLPQNADTCLSLSPVLLASSSATSGIIVDVPTSNDNSEILYGDQVYKFSLLRNFPTDGQLKGFYQIYNANLPSVLMSFKLYRDQKFINQTAEKEISAYTDPTMKLISSFFAVPYHNLPPGNYQLELVLREAHKDCSTSARVSFEVVPTSISGS